MKGEFYRMDFRAWNTGTIDLTLEQEAAYLRLCHAMYDAQGPIPDSIRLLQGIFRCGNVRAAALVGQLINAGKIQRTEYGKLNNERVTAELAHRHRVSNARQIAGASGGSADRVKVECGSSEGQVNTECGSSEAAVPSANPLKSHEPYQAIASASRSRGDKRRLDTPVAPKGAEPEGFVEFRAAYPKRSTAFPTTQARKRWLEAQRRGAVANAIIAGAKAYAAEQARIGKVGTGFVQTADVWLNRQRWQDYIEAEPPSKPPATTSDETWRDRVRSWRARGGYWPWQPSHPPDDHRTLVPRYILDEFGIPVPAMDDTVADTAHAISVSITTK